MTSKQAILVGVDTQTLVWALDEIKSDNPGKEQRALWLMRYLTEVKAQVVISTVVIGELLVRVDSFKHPEFVASLERRFLVVPYNVRAASKAAADYARMEDLKDSGQPDARKCFKADLMIVAQAWESGATHFFSDDGRCRKMASRMGIEARPLPVLAPTTGPQIPLFGPSVDP